MPTSCNSLSYIIVVLILKVITVTLANLARTNSDNQQRSLLQQQPYVGKNLTRIYVYKDAARIKSFPELPGRKRLPRINLIRFFKHTSQHDKNVSSSYTSRGVNNGKTTKQGRTHIRIFTDNPCQNSAPLAFTADGSHCVCKPGFKGIYCQDKDNCFQHACLNNGTCMDHKTGSECFCKNGYKGLHCETKDNCFPNHCENNGVCQEENGLARCSCQQGFSGVFCKQRLCESCDKNAKCVSGRCICNHGYIGDGQSCKSFSIPGPCSRRPCLNSGTCIELDETNYDCRCTEEYSGNDCEKRLNCVPNPCKNGGACFEREQSFRCVCPNNYTGKDCSKVVVFQDKCSPNPCKFGGICKTSEDGLRAFCQCPSYKFKPPFCECDCPKANTLEHKHSLNSFCDKIGNCICPQSNMYLTPWGCLPAVIMDNPCSSSPCQNDATCYNLSTSNVLRNDRSYGCRCTPGFSGSRCEIRMPDPCLPSPCKNGGTCEALKGVVVCTCKSGFVPPYCNRPELGVSKCYPNPCLNGGECFEKDNKYDCKCKEGFNGTHCQVVIDNCKGCNFKTMICFRGKCVCKPGFVGDGKYCVPILKGSKVAGHPIFNVVRRSKMIKNSTKNDTSQKQRLFGALDTL